MIGLLGKAIDRVAVRINADPEGLRFLVAGGVNFIFSFGIYPVLMFLPFLRARYLVALAIAQILCVLFSFTTQKLLAFRSHGAIASEFAKFAGFNAVGIIANWAIVPAVVELKILPPVIAQTIFAAIWTFGSFFWHKKVTFMKRG